MKAFSARPPVTEDGTAHTALGRTVTALFARTCEVQRIVQLVEAGTSVEIVGTRWSGRTEVLRRLHERFTALGLTTLVVRGVGSELPLEAVRAALPARPGNAADVTPSELVRKLSQAVGEGSTVVLLDDGDLLDRASWTVLELAHKRTGVPIVSTTLLQPAGASGHRLLATIAKPVVSITLDELKPDTVHALLESRLGGPISPSLSGRVYTKSAGIPGFALAIVDAARSGGSLSQAGSVWQDDHDLWSDDLRGAYESLLFPFCNDVREALETLAVVGPVPVSQAVSLAGPELIELMEGHGIVRLFSVGERHLIAVSPPGLGDYFRRLPLSARRLRLLDRVAQILGDDRGSHAELGIVSGDDLRPHQIPLIARMLSESYATESASALREWAQTRSVPAAIRVLRLHLTGPADDDRLGDVVTVTCLVDADPADELEYRFLHARWLQLQNRPFSEIETALTAEPDFPHRAGLAALLVGLRIERYGVPADVETALPPAEDDDGVDAELTRVVRVFAHILSGGDPAEADCLEHLRDPFAERLADLARGLALVSSGRLAETAEWSAAKVGAAIDAGDRSAVVAHTYIGVLAQTGLGRFDDAAEVGSIVISAGVSAGSLLFSPDRALMLALATAAHRANRVLAAEGLFARGEAFQGRSDGLPLGSLSVAEMGTIVAEGEAVVAAAKYLEAADDLARRGYGLAADSATILGLLSDVDPHAAEAFQLRGGGTGGRLFAAYLDARVASRDQDPMALVEIAQILREEQATDEALKHLTYAAQLLRDRGNAAEAAEIRRQIHQLVADDNFGTAHTLVHADSAWGLTAREREIVRDVAAGRSNTDIAEKFTVSVRTIETHLRNIRRKTGAIDRSDIGQFAL